MATAATHWVTLWTLSSGLCALLAFLVCAYVRSGPARWAPRDADREPISSDRLLLLAAVLGLGLTLLWRFALAGQGFELAVDAGTFRAWALAVARIGTGGLYSSAMMVDYPPVYLGVLGFFGAAAQFLGVAHHSPWMARLLLIGPLVAEVAMALVVARLAFASGRQSGTGGLPGRGQLACAALLVSGVLLVPHIVSNSSLFGQVDAAPSFGVVLSAAVLAGAAPGAPLRLAVSAALFALALLTKPVAVFALPVGFVWVMALWWPAGKGARLAMAGAILAFLCAWTLVVLLAAGFDSRVFTLVVAKIFNVVTSYPYASLNAANLYAFLGLNWRELGGPDAPSWLGLPLVYWGKALLVVAIGFVAAATYRDAQAWQRATRSREAKAQQQRRALESLLFFIGVMVT